MIPRNTFPCISSFRGCKELVICSHMSRALCHNIQLDGFIKQVQAEVRVHRLSTTNALELIQSAQVIQNALGCKQ
jgi:hypothetical protein